MGSADIYILGQQYVIKGDSTSEYIRELANVINKEIDAIVNVSPNIQPVKAMVLASMNLADKLYKSKEDNDKLFGIMEKNIKLISDLLDGK